MTALRAAWLLGLMSWAACRVDVRSGQFECAPGDQCETGRVCQDGWCVLIASDDTGDGGSDDGTGCPLACNGGCPGGLCRIDCNGALGCSNEVICPPGYACEVNCTDNATCSGGIDCSMAVACDIDCTGDGACNSPITCGAGPCDVLCSGPQSCTGGLDCTASCSCRTSCPGDGSCDPRPDCAFGGPCGGSTCSDTPPGQCNQC